ncbi:MAG: Flagellin [Pelotomaculum sp. PtaB.Bin104]|nr:MAG: Flagellin [Pelotomaculum sp. PtaB.Bin104]
MIINHNLPALDAYNKLSYTNGLLAKSLEKLSSGLRINRAGDDAAGLAISEKMRAQIRGLDQATRNSQDGISLIQTAEGALNETHSILQRMRELSVQAANDTLTLNDRQEIQKEVDQLKLEINRIANTTEFNTKKLLDGTAAALVSSDVESTQIIVNGQVQNFGNYNLGINVSTIGVGQVQKTDIFKSADLQMVNKVVNNVGSGVNDVSLASASGNRLPEGNYEVSTNVTLISGAESMTELKGYFQSSTSVTAAFVATGFGTSGGSGGSGNATVVMEVASISGTQVTFNINVYGALNDGTNAYSILNKQITFTATGTADESATWNAAFGTAGAGLNATCFTLVAASNFKVGDKVMLQYAAATSTSYVTMKISGDGTISTTRTLNFNASISGMATLMATVLDNKPTYDVWDISMNTTTGTVYEGKLQFNIGTIISSGATPTTAATFDISASGSLAVANVGTTLDKVDRFTDASGNFLLATQQKITIYEGDGKSTEVTFYGTDTLEDVRQKLNDAIADGLGQRDLVDAAAARNFVTYVSNAQTSGQEAVAGTFVIRSGVTGAKGELTFSGDQAFINALSLTTIQDSAETQFIIDVTNAHTGVAVASDEKISGNRLVGIVDDNVDVIFDPNADTLVAWNATTKSFDITADGTNTTTTTVHVADNSLIFQIGANANQNVNASIGRMDSLSLGVDSILVTDNESATRAMTAIDAAITKVSSQRANLGAIQNRLEHTINNLTVSSENLTAAESRIRDVDMAKEMMNYAKLNILSQAGTAMLAQANQLPQNILTLLR